MEADSIKIIINLVYIVSAILFVLGIKMLGKADTARKGNLVSSVAMFVAVIATFFDPSIEHAVMPWVLIISAVALGGVIGLFAAKKVEMTSMPELVALFNGFGGLASLLVAWAEFAPGGDNAMLGFTRTAVILAVLIGGITFTGSIYAWAKLSGKISGSAQVFGGQKLVNGAIAGALILSSIAFASVGDYSVAAVCLGLVIVLSLVLGIAAVMPIGGGDMPVVISLLNSLSGLAACAAGFVIKNNVLIVAGCLVGASGVILTVIMCKAMNRTLFNVLFSGFGSTAQADAGEIEGEMKGISTEDAFYVLEAAQSVIFIPGYGMAVAQAQHAVKELSALLEDRGVEVSHAIHPVAGRMPGHMNVLLAEADVPYEQLSDMETANAVMDNVDVAIVIGANDVVNPAAIEDEASPIYGMPIIECHRAKTVFCLKRGQGAGFSGLVNKLFFAQNTRMIYGDAKATITDLVAAFKD
ncbi:MAG: NAD(P)(+) transhydrogenase (Re/Si-specific) subunit beta [Opitutales bacterium]